MRGVGRLKRGGVTRGQGTHLRGRASGGAREVDAGSRGRGEQLHVRAALPVPLPGCAAPAPIPSLPPIGDQTPQEAAHAPGKPAVARVMPSSKGETGGGMRGE